VKLPDVSSLFEMKTFVDVAPLGFAVVLFLILVISFRSRAIVFCQYLKAMTGVSLSPKEVRRTFKAQGQDGVRTLFLDLIIREDLKTGPLNIPEGAKPTGTTRPLSKVRGKIPT